MKFHLLGPLEVVHDGAPLPIRAAKQRIVLAALLVDANRVVPLDVLVARVWDGDPPSRTAIHNLVMRLRHTLGADVIRTRSDGYLIEAAEDDLDLRRFDALVRQAKASTDPEGVSSLLTEALGLWRGEPLADVPSDVLQREVVPGLVERRLAALEERIDADLELGRHHDLVAELRELTDRHPLREHFWGQRMLALHRSGRQADALDCYREIAKILADELGIDPGARLRELHQHILTNDAPRSAPVPRQLPTRTPHFVGRVGELRQLGDYLDLAGETVVISAVNGTAGIGKTTLAMHWAHEVADRFPDGQLYVNLRGFGASSEHMHPAEAVRGFLDAFGVPPERVPSSLDSQTALYRSLLADRRVLVLLDNARDADQVRPLLTASPSCLVLVTSRNQLTGLVAREGARPIPLDLLSTAEATALLRKHLGGSRVDAEPYAVAELIEHCARVPLAVSLMAARAAVNPRLSVRTLADDLRDEQRRLDALDADDPDHGMRAVFSYSYRQVSPAAARLFRLLGSHPGPDVSTTAAASLAGVPVDEARRLLDELTTAHLVSAQGGRFVLHDLLRVYAAEQPDGERRAATLRVLDHYLHSANAADVRLHATRRRIALDQPGVGVVVEEHSSRDDAVRWCTAEHKALVEAVALAAGSGFDQHTWQLAWATASYFDVHGHWADWAKTQQVALAVTERLRDLPAQVRVCSSLGHAYARMRQLDEARAHFARGLSLSEASGDRSAQGGAHSSLGWMAEQEGRFEDALRHSRRALELFTETGNRSAQGRARAAIGWDLTQLGHLDEALVECGQALEVFRENMDVWYEASVLDTIGLVHHRASRYAEAIGYFRKALETQVDSLSTSTALVHLGDALLATGDAEGARRSWQEALTILEELGSPTADELRTKLRGS